MTGGVTIKDRNRIQFDFKFDGVRYRPTLLSNPTLMPSSVRCGWIPLRFKRLIRAEWN
jgi:hypothetical protein